MKDAPRRFPTFWGPGQDWVPDHNWGGSGMIGVQEMLMQTVGNDIHILPAWPMNWDVTFKLHANLQTTVECVVKDGKVVSLKITPEERAHDVITVAKVRTPNTPPRFASTYGLNHRGLDS
jgi:hypothetical protein